MYTIKCASAGETPYGEFKTVEEAVKVLKSQGFMPYKPAEVLGGRESETLFYHPFSPTRACEIVRLDKPHAIHVLFPSLTPESEEKAHHIATLLSGGSSQHPVAH